MLSEADTAKAQVTDARAQLQFEETMLRHRTLLAPYDALIVERHKEVGTIIKAGDPIFTLIAADSYWGLAYVDEARAGFIREGQRVDARLRSRPQDTFTGRVWITVAQLDMALLVPEAAVHGYDGRQGWVWTVEATRLQRHLVKFRHRTEDAMLEIVDGLPEGVRVVTRIEDGFREGRSARLMDAGAK